MIKTISTLPWILLIALSLIWGSSFILIKKALIGFEADYVAALRVLISFLAFLPWILIRISRVRLKSLILLGCIGLFGNGLPAILYSVAQTKVASGTAGILNGLTPIFTMIIGAIFFAFPLTRNKIIGTILGFLGACFLFLDGLDIQHWNEYVLLIVLATIFYGLNANLIQKYFQNWPPMTIGACSFILIGPISLIYILSTSPGEIHWAQSEVLWSLAAIVVLSLFSTFLATVLFYRLVQLSDALFSSSVSYLAPFIAVLWALVDHESIGLMHLLSLIMILGGVYLIRKKTN